MLEGTALGHIKNDVAYIPNQTGGDDQAGRRRWSEIGSCTVMCYCVVTVVEKKSRAWRRVTHWLSPRLLPLCRSSDDEPNGGVTCRNGAVTKKVHWIGFSVLQMSDSDEGFWSFLGRRF